MYANAIDGPQLLTCDTENSPLQCVTVIPQLYWTVYIESDIEFKYYNIVFFVCTYYNYEIEYSFILIAVVAF